MENGSFIGEDYFEHLLAEIREIRLNERRPMTMEDWAKRIDIILEAGGDAVLHDAEKITPSSAYVYFSISATKILRETSAIQKKSVTLSSVVTL